jgi:hypothetical protein
MILASTCGTYEKCNGELGNLKHFKIPYVIEILIPGLLLGHSKAVQQNANNKERKIQTPVLC